jgi:hypothetical protein
LQVTAFAKIGYTFYDGLHVANLLGNTLSVVDYMLKNKTDAAFQLLDKKGAALAAPGYIQQAVTWIRA